MSNNTDNTTNFKNEVEIGQFRLGLIAPVINKTYPDSSAADYYKRIVSKDLFYPDGKKLNIKWNTLEKWVSLYRRCGFEALMPKTRSDKGSTRVISDVAIEKIYELKTSFPRINATQIYLSLRENGYIENDVSLSSIQRFVKNNNLKDARNPGMKDRKAFEEDSFGKMWQADTKYMPYINEDGVSKRVYNISIIDDHSRLIVGGALFYEDNAINFQKVLKSAISTYGIPDKLYVDNGCSYRNEQLSLICGSLGVVLIHTKIRDGASKAKIERYWSTLDQRFNFVTDFSNVSSLKQFNELYRSYIREYNTREHSGIKCTPYERYNITSSYPKKPKSSLWLDECFLNRVRRKVKLDSTISIDSELYDVPMEFIKQSVEIRFEPGNQDNIFIFYEGKKYPIRKTNKNENARTKRNNVLDYSRIGGER